MHSVQSAYSNMTTEGADIKMGEMPLVTGPQFSGNIPHQYHDYSIILHAAPMCIINVSNTLIMLSWPGQYHCPDLQLGLYLVTAWNRVNNCVRWVKRGRFAHSYLLANGPMHARQAETKSYNSLHLLVINLLTLRCNGRYINNQRRWSLKHTPLQKKGGHGHLLGQQVTCMRAVSRNRWLSLEHERITIMECTWYILPVILS